MPDENGGNKYIHQL